MYLLSQVSNFFKKREKGQGMVEYGLILALVSVVAIGSLGGIGGKVSSTFGTVMSDSSIEEDSLYNNGRYRKSEIESLISQGYIPVSSAEELSNISKGGKFTFGNGSEWQKEYDADVTKDYIQINNIDLTSVDSFDWIGNKDNPYSGTFDGGGFKIKDLKIHHYGAGYVGMFGETNGATLKNIALEGGMIDTQGNSGTLIGKSENTKVVNSYSTVDIDVDGAHRAGSGYTGGGLVGYNGENSTIENSYATGTVWGESDTGGLVGINRGSIINSYAAGNIFGNHFPGGLVGGSTSGQSGSIDAKSGWYEGIKFSTDADKLNSVGRGISESEITSIIENLIK